MAGHALTLCVTRPSATMVLTMYDKQALTFYQEGFLLSGPSRCPELRKT